ncbi:hypothetical protein [Acetobacter papayae]|uniref:hypothetical protein n=1 Tax=Acetobacter papayae TaxID=1076592 RepID=UPI001F28CE53|nr:hypothetical protein [Acetobacter papayae]
MSTFSGSEVGCHVASAVLDITTSAQTVANVHAVINQFAQGLADIRSRHADWFVGIRQEG